MVIGGIWAASSQVNEKLRMNRCYEAINYIVSNFRNQFPRVTIAYGSTVDYTPTAIAMKIIPEDFISGSSTISPIGGAVKIWVGNVNAGYPMCFDVIFEGLSQSQCRQMLNKLSVLDRDGTQILAAGIAYIGPWYTPTNNALWIRTWPIPLSTTACAAGKNNITACFKF